MSMVLPEHLAVACGLQPAQPLLQGADAWFWAWQGRWKRWQRPLRPLLAQAQRVHTACVALQSLGTEALQQRLAQARAALRLDPKNAQGGLAEALATVGEIARRDWGFTPHVVQFAGALALHRGMMAEMATGEGKTLTVGLAGVLAGLSGRPCHVITANDYLARRDAEEMAPLYQACGLRVAWVVGELEPPQRLLGHGADVVYLTAKELLADFLRDEMAAGSPRQRQERGFFAWWGTPAAPEPTRLLVRGLHTAIVDEADSILIDEAVTPLILAFPRASGDLASAVRTVAKVAEGLQPDTDYVPMVRGQTVRLLPSASAQLSERAADLPPLWRPVARREELLRQALLVRCFFKPGQHYVVQDGEVVLLDEFTGRMTPGRSLTAGLHQAIEAAEGLEITEPNQAMAQMSFQHFFRRFHRLCGCSGTVAEAHAELWRVYGLEVVCVPTHRPRQTRYAPPVLVATAAQKWQQVAQEVLREQARGRPVLVGVRSVGASEALATVLRQRACSGLQVLNALAHAEEAQMVAHAGEAGRVTIATNMAGRGTDIRLGPEVKAAGGLHVIVAESNDSQRIDRQLAGRCGRQGDPGSVATFLCLEDDLVQRTMPAWMLRLLSRASQGGVRSVWSWWAVWGFAQAQRRAEALAFQRRWSVLRNDDWMTSALPFEGHGQAQS